MSCDGFDGWNPNAFCTDPDAWVDPTTRDGFSDDESDEEEGSDVR